MELRPFYLNVVLLNKRAVVKEQVSGKVGRGIFGRAMASVASSVVSDSAVIEKIANELVGRIQRATADMGITATLQRRYHKGPYVCLKVSILEIEKMQLILAAKGAEYASSFSTLLVALTDLGLAETALPKIDEKIETLVHQNIMLKFEEKIPPALEEQGVECSVAVVSAEEQAEYFFDAVEALGLN